MTSHRPTVRTVIAAAAMAAALGILLGLAIVSVFPRPAAAQETLRVYGHRAAAFVPHISENTLEAVEYARKNGAYGVELDFRLTADGRWVTLHDTNFSRTSTTCVGGVAQKTVKQAQACKLRDGSHVMSLEQVAAWSAKYRMHVDADMKNHLTPAQAAKFAKTVAKYKATSYFEPNGADNEAALAALGMRPSYVIPSGETTLTHVHVKVDATTITRAQVKALHYQHDTVTTYGPVTAAQVAALHVDGVMVDDPKAWR